MEQSFIVGGENYGQGSSREHAAITPMFLGVKVVFVKSIARIHRNNLVNHGIVPMIFETLSDYDTLDLGDELKIENFIAQIQTRRVLVQNVTKKQSFCAKAELSDEEVQIILSGGQLPHIKSSFDVNVQAQGGGTRSAKSGLTGPPETPPAAKRLS